MALPKKGYKPGIYRFVSGTVDGNGDFSITNIPKDGYVSGIYQLTEVTIDADGNTSVAEDDIGITAAIEVTVDGSGDLSVTEVPEEGYVSGVYRVTTSTNIPKEGFNQIDFSAVIGTISGGKWESGPGIQFNAALTNSLIPSPAVAATYTFARADTDATVTDFEGLVKDVTANEARFHGARRVRNLATGLVTETITVVSGSEYQVTIAGGSGDTAVASGAFTGTLTANGTNRISWNSGTPKTAASTSLTLTITGTLTEMLVEDVTGQANQNPSENIVIGAEHGTNAGNVKYFNYQNNNTVAGSGVVTEAQGADIADATLQGVLVEDQTTNINTYSQVLDAQWSKLNGATITDGAGPFLHEANMARCTSSAKSSEVERAGGTGYVDNVVHTLSMYVAEDTSTRFRCEARVSGGTSASLYCEWTWTVGVPVFASSSGIIAGSDFVIETTPGSGIYRVGFSLLNAGGNTSVTQRLYPDRNTGTGSTFADGAQVEANNYSTSYIPTRGSAATRNAESLSYPNTNILNDEGTLAITFTPNGSSADYGNFARALVGVRGVGADLLHIDISAGEFVVADGTTTTTSGAMPSLVSGTTVKLAARWSATTSLMDIGQDTVEDQVAFDGSMNKSTAMRIGYSGSKRASGTCKNLIVYNGSVTDATFTGLTT